jgi:hypothetical protein
MSCPFCAPADPGDLRGELAEIYTRDFLYTSLGKTPWATIGAKLATETTIFERVGPGRYRLRRDG